MGTISFRFKDTPEDQAFATALINGLRKNQPSPKNMIKLIHPDTHQLAKIASSNIDDSFSGTLSNIKGSPSDGYKADILNQNGQVAGSAINHMDGEGWYCRFLSARPVAV